MALQRSVCSLARSVRHQRQRVNVRLVTPKRQKVTATAGEAVTLTGTATGTAPAPTYDEVFRRSIDNPEEHWAEAAEQLVWYKKWDKVLDNSNPPHTKWFVGGELNTCYNAVDRHVDAGFGQQVAVIHDSPVTGTIQRTTYGELQKKVALFAGVLAKHGVAQGDRVLIYMPMITEAVIAMLACARLGALHSLVFGGFASKELAIRINHAEPKLIVSANCSIEPGRVIEYKPLIDRAIELSEFKPRTCIIFNREHELFNPATMIGGRDFDYDDQMAMAQPHDCVPVSATDPIYLLYTSGTTGIPKAVIRPSGGHAVALHSSMENVYGVKPHETWFAASDLGWVVGHSYIVYAPLLHCNTTVLYEGKPVGTPDPSSYYRMLQEHNIAAMFVAPTAMRVLRREDPEGHYSQKYSFPNFRYMFIAGEYCDHETLNWVMKQFKIPALDNWWQTESGSPMTCTCVGLGNDLYPPAGVTGKPVPGWNVKVMHKDMTEADVHELGHILVKLPLPPAAFSGLWNSGDRFEKTYFTEFPGYYDTQDAGFRDEDGNIAVTGRLDDVINVAGHRLSTGQMEEAILEHHAIAEAAVVPIHDDIKGSIPLALCVIKMGIVTSEEQIIREVIQTVRNVIGPVASFRNAVIVAKLPKTRSGKVARHTIADMIAGKPYRIPVTIEDASVYPHLRQVLQSNGYFVSKPIE